MDTVLGLRGHLARAEVVSDLRLLERACDGHVLGDRKVRVAHVVKVEDLFAGPKQLGLFKQAPFVLRHVNGNAIRRSAPVALAILNEGQTRVIVVKTRRPIPASFESEMVGQSAISILVDKWFAENSYHADEFTDLAALLDLKRKQGLTISLALPALNEEETVGNVIQTIKQALMDQIPLLDEIILVDSDSTDRTRQIAGEMGIPTFIHQQILPKYGARRGKGAGSQCNRLQCREERQDGHEKGPAMPGLPVESRAGAGLVRAAGDGARLADLEGLEPFALFGLPLASFGDLAVLGKRELGHAKPLARGIRIRKGRPRRLTAFSDANLPSGTEAR